MKIVQVLTALLLAPAALAQGPAPDGPWNDATKSYQERATLWLTQRTEGVNGLADGVQRYALACLFFATYAQVNKYSDGTAEWVVTDNWLSDENVCDWFGITCDDKNVVEKIDLHSNGLTGIFPLEMGTLGRILKYIDISDNEIANINSENGWMSGMEKLLHLDIHYTNFDYPGIPTYIGDITSLEYLDVSETWFYGPLLGAIFQNLQNLTYLDIGDNSFEFNAFPDEIASLPKLENLYIEFTDLGGTLDWMKLLNPGIKQVWTDRNPFGFATIPSEVGNLVSLESLSLVGCELEGSLPTELGMLQNMTEMWFYNNTLDGIIPTEIGTLSNLVTFRTEDNMMMGEMPSEICDLTDDLLKQLATDCLGPDEDVTCSCCQCCESPCFPPTVPLPGFCFSGDSLVEVANKGHIRMNDLKINDEVHVGNGEFSRVYSFGHYNTHTTGKYLRLFSSELDRPLEISKDHMLFVEQRGAVPAATVSVGDNLSLGNGRTTKVTKIANVNSVGVFAPFTESGTIVVNGVLASSYVSLQPESEFFSAGGVKIVSMHWLAHAFQAPHRMICKINASFCTSETYSEEGISNWVYGPHLASKWLLDQHAAVFAVLSVFVILSGVALYLIEACFLNIGLVAAATFGLFVYVAGGKQKAKAI
jgi:Leucine-rich repeat (LRR) protein